MTNSDMSLLELFQPSRDGASAVRKWLLRNRLMNIELRNQWTRSVIEGALGSMSKQHGNETIKVRFSTNGIMPSLEDQDQIEEMGKEVLWFVILHFWFICKEFYIVIQHLKLSVSDQEKNQSLLHVKWRIRLYMGMIMIQMIMIPTRLLIFQ